MCQMVVGNNKQQIIVLMVAPSVSDHFLGLTLKELNLKMCSDSFL